MTNPAKTAKAMFTRLRKKTGSLHQAADIIDAKLAKLEEQRLILQIAQEIAHTLISTLITVDYSTQTQAAKTVGSVMQTSRVHTAPAKERSIADQLDDPIPIPNNYMT